MRQEDYITRDRPSGIGRPGVAIKLPAVKPDAADKPVKPARG